MQHMNGPIYHGFHVLGGRSNFSLREDVSVTEDRLDGLQLYHIWLIRSKRRLRVCDGILLHHERRSSGRFDRS